MAHRKRLGEMLIEAGLINEQQLKEALRLQIGGSRRLGYLLIKLGFINEHELQTVLAEQLGVPIISVQQKFDPAVKRLLPRFLCRKYGILPLALADNNRLLVAMSDPSDQEAIADIERYTDKVVEPLLAAQGDIDRGIRQFIPWSLQDLRNPLVASRLTGAMALLALALICVVGYQYYTDKQLAKYGHVRESADVVSYENHELIVAFHRDGKISLLGRGAHAAGYYKVSFPDLGGLRRFIQLRKQDFSSTQLEWLTWVLHRQGNAQQGHGGANMS